MCIHVYIWIYLYPNLYTPVCVLYMKAVNVYNYSEMKLASSSSSSSSGHEKEKTK